MSEVQRPNIKIHSPILNKSKLENVTNSDNTLINQQPNLIHDNSFQAKVELLELQESLPQLFRVN